MLYEGVAARIGETDVAEGKVSCNVRHIRPLLVLPFEVHYLEEPPGRNLRLGVTVVEFHDLPHRRREQGDHRVKRHQFSHGEFSAENEHRPGAEQSYGERL